MKINILKKELISYESEFEFFSNVIDNYKIDFDNLRKPYAKPFENPSKTILKIVQLLQHKTQRTTNVFNDMLTICEQAVNDNPHFAQKNTMIFAEILEEITQYFDSVTKRVENLKLRIEDLKQRVLIRDVRGRPQRIEGSSNLDMDQPFKYDEDVSQKNKNRGLEHLDGILAGFNQ
jgi:hypothetical protein